MPPSMIAELRPFNCVPVTHLPLSGLKSDRRRGYSIGDSLAKSNEGEIGVSQAKADTPHNLRYFCVQSMASPLWAGCATASIDAPVPLPGTPTSHGSAHLDWRQGGGIDYRSKGLSTMHTPTQSASIVRRYTYRVVHPASNTSTIVTAQTPTQALSVFGQWFSVPTSQLAINRRSPAQEVAHG